MKRSIPITLVTGVFSLCCLFAGLYLTAHPSGQKHLLSCPVNSIFAVPCFSCGITRVYLHLAKGEVVDAFLLAPMPALFATGSILLLLYTLLTLATKRRTPDAALARWLGRDDVLIGFASAFVLFWAYAIVRSIFTGSP